MSSTKKAMPQHEEALAHQCDKPLALPRRRGRDHPCCPAPSTTSSPSATSSTGFPYPKRRASPWRTSCLQGRVTRVWLRRNTPSCNNVLPSTLTRSSTPPSPHAPTNDRLNNNGRFMNNDPSFCTLLFPLHALFIF
jgi:hypothetical protein